MDELDQEVAFISKMHQEKKSKNKYKNKDLDGITTDHLSMKDKMGGDATIWAKVDEWFKKCDKNKDRKLDKEEMKPYIKNWSQEELGPEGGKAMAEDIFHEMDKNGDLRIDRQELFAVIKELLEMREGSMFQTSNEIASHNDINIQLDEEDSVNKEIKARLFEEE